MEHDSRDIRRLLGRHEIRPTKIRMAIAGLLFDGLDKHVTVDDVIALARARDIKTSVASVYNTLNYFAAAGLLRRVTVEQGRAFFDTNLSAHHHFYFEDEGRLEDIPAGALQISGLPKLPKGREIKSVDVTIRL
ncbi:MAG: transcriptional repressor [Robiginitomaculum sp.]|nr:MAG: transcriptional repressor [Robiginitomaculum sp.]